MLEIRDLHVETNGKEIIKGLDLEIKKGEIHVLMGPNGSGKSTLSYALMGHPKYKITRGDVLFEGESVKDLSPDKRSKLGIFLSFQYPMEVQGVQLSNFIRLATDNKNFQEFREDLSNNMSMLKMDKSFGQRYLNDGFSGGEKKRGEILQMAMLKPKLAILDETDSGLDIDALKTVAEGINTVNKNVNSGILLITHYQRILKFVKPDYVHIISDGKIVQTGGADLVDKLEEEGYEWVSKNGHKK